MKSNTLNITIALSFLLLGAYLAFNFPVGALTTLQDQSTNNQYRNYTFFATTTAQATNNDMGYATSTNATSTNIAAWFNDNSPFDRVNGAFDVRGAEEVTLYFQRGDTSGQGNTGNTRFNVEVSPDGTKWHRYPRLMQATTSITSIHPVEFVTITAASSTEIYGLDLDYTAYGFIRCIVVEATDGEHSCRASARY